MATSAGNLRFDDFVALIVPTAAAYIIAVNSTTLVQSFQNNIIMPFLSLTPGVDGNFDNAGIVLKPAVTDSTGAVIQPQVLLQIGSFLSSLVSFIIIIFITYVLIIAAFNMSQGKIDGTKKL